MNKFATGTFESAEELPAFSLAERSFLLAHIENI
jgi:hypothetical protein